MATYMKSRTNMYRQTVRNNNFSSLSVRTLRMQRLVMSCARKTSSSSCWLPATIRVSRALFSR